MAKLCWWSGHACILTGSSITDLWNHQSISVIAWMDSALCKNLFTITETKVDRNFFCSLNIYEQCTLVRWISLLHNLAHAITNVKEEMVGDSSWCSSLSKSLRIENSSFGLGSLRSKTRIISAVLCWKLLIQAHKLEILFILAFTNKQQT